MFLRGPQIIIFGCFSACTVQLSFLNAEKHCNLSFSNAKKHFKLFLHCCVNFDFKRAI